MSQHTPDIPPGLEDVFAVFLADRTEPASMVYVTPVYAIRAAFRAWLREHEIATGRPSAFQISWLLENANVQTENMPTRTGPKMLHACGIRLVMGDTK